MKVKSDHRSKFSNLTSWKEEAWKKKNQGFNGIRTRVYSLDCEISKTESKPRLNKELNI